MTSKRCLLGCHCEEAYGSPNSRDVLLRLSYNGAVRINRDLLVSIQWW